MRVALPYYPAQSLEVAVINKFHYLFESQCWGSGIRFVRSSTDLRYHAGAPGTITTTRFILPANGTFLGAGEQCTENACASSPVTGACCHTGGCTITEEASCTGEGYDWAGADTACIETSAAPQCLDQVACCSDGTCSEVSPEMCANVNGIDAGNCSDPSHTCEATITGACFDLTANECE